MDVFRVIQRSNSASLRNQLSACSIYYLDVNEQHRENSFKTIFIALFTNTPNDDLPPSVFKHLIQCENGHELNLTGNDVSAPR